MHVLTSETPQEIQAQVWNWFHCMPGTHLQHIYLIVSSWLALAFAFMAFYKHLLAFPVVYTVIILILLLSPLDTLELIIFLCVCEWASMWDLSYNIHLFVCVLSLTLKVVFFHGQVIFHSCTLSFGSYWNYMKSMSAYTYLLGNQNYTLHLKLLWPCKRISLPLLEWDIGFL